MPNTKRFPETLIAITTTEQSNAVRDFASTNGLSLAAALRTLVARGLAGGTESDESCARRWLRDADQVAVPRYALDVLIANGELTLSKTEA